jgi:hypothetical protein
MLVLKTPVPYLQYFLLPPSYPKSLIHRRSTQNAWLIADQWQPWRRKLVLDILWYRIDCVVRGCLFTCTGPASCRASLQVGSCRLGQIVYVYVWSGVLLWPFKKATLDSMCTLSWFVSYRPHLSFNFLSLLLSRYLSLCSYLPPLLPPPFLLSVMTTEYILS